MAGALRVKMRNQDQTDLLLRQNRFLGKPATSSVNQELVFVEAYAYAPALLNVAPKRITTEPAVQGVVGVRRLRPKKTGEKNPACASASGDVFSQPS